MTEFKVGDKVRLKSGRPFTSGKYVETVREWDFLYKQGNSVQVTDCTHCHKNQLELVEGKEVQYENKWRLNDGSESIPDDAEKLYNPEGTSVVAYRLVKQPVVKEFTRYVGPPSGYAASTILQEYHTHKITYIEVEGELTEVLLEKL